MHIAQRTSLLLIDTLGCGCLSADDGCTSVSVDPSGGEPCLPIDGGDDDVFQKCKAILLI